MNEQVQTIIASNNNFLIVSDKLARPEIFLAREALRLVLEASGKRVFSHPKLPDYFFERFQVILPEERGGNFSYTAEISVPKLLQIKEVCYEENENNFLIIITSKSKIEEKNLTIKEKPEKIEVLFLLASELNAEDLQSKFELPPREHRVNIVKNHITISKKIFDIAEKFNLNSAHKRQFATLLYAALIYETKNFRNIADAEVFDLAKTFLSFGVDKEKISEILNLAKSVSFSHILGRALARTHIDRQTSSSWTFITGDDIVKSGVKSSDFTIEALADSLHDNIPEVKTALVFFEDPPGVRCFVESEDKQIIAELAKKFQQRADGNAVYSKRFENFTKAEKEFRELLITL